MIPLIITGLFVWQWLLAPHDKQGWYGVAALGMAWYTLGYGF